MPSKLDIGPFHPFILFFSIFSLSLYHYLGPGFGAVGDRYTHVVDERVRTLKRSKYTERIEPGSQVYLDHLDHF